MKKTTTMKTTNVMRNFLLSFLTITLLFSCKENEKETEENEENEGTVTYVAPDSYNFNNVSYSGQTERLDMLEELTSYVKTGTTEGTTLDAEKLKEMFANTNNRFSNDTLNNSTKQLENKCFEGDVSEFISYFDSLELISGKVGGSNGKAGIVTNGAKSYLCNAKGFEYAQLIDKGLMGAVFYYQVSETYLSDTKIGDDVDNVIVKEGKGTDKEHHFDEAFGYFGIPTDFPANTEDGRFWGKYCNKRDGLMETNKIMDSWKKGRWAISNNDKSALDNAIKQIKLEWEKVSVGCALHYLNAAIDHIEDDALRNHELSEAVAFIKALKYNSNAIITNTERQEVLDAIGDNLYDVTTTGLNNALSLLAGHYDLGDKKTQF